MWDLISPRMSTYSYIQTRVRKTMIMCACVEYWSEGLPLTGWSERELSSKSKIDRTRAFGMPPPPSPPPPASTTEPSSFTVAAAAGGTRLRYRVGNRTYGRSIRRRFCWSSPFSRLWSVVLTFDLNWAAIFRGSSVVKIHASKTERSPWARSQTGCLGVSPNSLALDGQKWASRPNHIWAYPTDIYLQIIICYNIQDSNMV